MVRCTGVRSALLAAAALLHRAWAIRDALDLDDDSILGGTQGREACPLQIEVTGTSHQGYYHGLYQQFVDVRNPPRGDWPIYYSVADPRRYVYRYTVWNSWVIGTGTSPISTNHGVVTAHGILAPACPNHVRGQWVESGPSGWTPNPRIVVAAKEPTKAATAAVRTEPTTEKSKTHYELLGVLPTATKGEIDKAWRQLSRRLHPDKHQDDPTAQENFQRAERVHEILSDEVKRKQYDENPQGCPEMLHVVLKGTAYFPEAIGYYIRLATSLNHQPVYAHYGPADQYSYYLYFAQGEWRIHTDYKSAAAVPSFKSEGSPTPSCPHDLQVWKRHIDTGRQIGGSFAVDDGIIVRVQAFCPSKIAVSGSDAQRSMTGFFTGYMPDGSSKFTYQYLKDGTQISRPVYSLQKDAIVFYLQFDLATNTWGISAQGFPVGIRSQQSSRPMPICPHECGQWLDLRNGLSSVPQLSPNGNIRVETAESYEARMAVQAQQSRSMVTTASVHGNYQPPQQDPRQRHPPLQQHQPQRTPMATGAQACPNYIAVRGQTNNVMDSYFKTTELLVGRPVYQSVRASGFTASGDRISDFVYFGGAYNAWIIGPRDTSFRIRTVSPQSESGHMPYCPNEVPMASWQEFLQHTGWMRTHITVVPQAPRQQAPPQQAHTQRSSPGYIPRS